MLEEKSEWNIELHWLGKVPGLTFNTSRKISNSSFVPCTTLFKAFWLAFWWHFKATSTWAAFSCRSLVFEGVESESKIKTIFSDFHSSICTCNKQSSTLGPRRMADLKIRQNMTRRYAFLARDQSRFSPVARRESSEEENSYIPSIAEV